MRLHSLEVESWLSNQLGWGSIPNVYYWFFFSVFFLVCRGIRRGNGSNPAHFLHKIIHLYYNFITFYEFSTLLWICRKINLTWCILMMRKRKFPQGDTPWLFSNACFPSIWRTGLSLIDNMLRVLLYHSEMKPSQH